MTPWPLIAQIILQGDPLIIKANARFAGAIHSVTWRGVQFVDHYDHGREIQVAAHVYGFGGSECYNPTEAGSQSDGIGPTSSSEILGAWQGERGFSTSSRMAFWDRPKERSPGCLTGGANTTVVSDFVLNKIVKLEGDGLLIYDFAMDVPESYGSATIEAPVMYMPKVFSKFRFFDPINQIAMPALARERSEFPIMVGTGNGHAAAMWSEGALQSFNTFRDTNSLIVARKMVPFPNAVYSFKTYVAFGNSKSVKAAITRAYSEKP